MSKPNEYKVKSFEDLCDLVNDDNVNVLVVDLAKWLISYNFTIGKIRESYPIKTKGLTNTEIAKGYFTWIDDGKNEFHGTIIEQ